MAYNIKVHYPTIKEAEQMLSRGLRDLEQLTNQLLEAAQKVIMQRDKFLPEIHKVLEEAKRRTAKGLPVGITVEEFE